MRRLAALAAVALLATACGSGDDDSDDAGPGPDGPAAVEADEGIAGVVAVRITDRSHTDDTVDYDRHPPAGGDHHAVWLNCGFYDEAFPVEHLVHDLEHGAVWLAYDPDLPAGDLATLHDLVRAEQKVVATPDRGLDPGVAVVATAWARQLSLTAVEDPRLVEFIEQYRDGDQAPESGVTCVDSPLGDPLP